MQRRIPAFVRQIDVRPEGRQYFDGGDVSLRRRQVQRRTSVRIGGVDGAAGGEKRLSDGGSILHGGVMKGRLAVVVAVIDVGAQANQTGCKRLRI